MTQLIIDGTEAVLSTSFSTTVKRENSILTKNGEYTYDCTLRLDNHTNRRLYGFLHRINKKGFVDTKRSAVLIADGHVYCRGTEVITGWTDKEVKIQIVSGNSELNYFIGASLKVEWLDMGAIDDIRNSWLAADNPLYGDIDFALPSIRNHAEGSTYNKWKGHKDCPELLEGDQYNQHLRAQPYLCALVRRIIEALGYTIGINQLETSPFRNVIIINTVNTLKYCEMLPGWTVKDFMEEVEKLCNCCFIVDNEHRVCDIWIRSSYYQSGEIAALRWVVDEYETEVGEPSEDYSTSDIRYDFDEGKLERLQDCEEILPILDIVECADFDAVQTTLDGIATTAKSVALDTSTGRYYIRIDDPVARTPIPVADHLILEVNTFAPLRRDGAIGEISIGIVPVPMIFTRRIKRAHYELKPILGSDGSSTDIDSDDSIDDDTTDADDAQFEDYSMEDFIGSVCRDEDTSKGKLYAAIYNGYHKTFKGWYPLCYTDAYNMALVSGLRYLSNGGFQPYYPQNDNFNDEYEGTLRLQDIDGEIYNGTYAIDTTKSVTFETFDRMVADPRQVLNVKNKLWVIREIEETITATGRKPRWKVVCHPINITATGEQVAWVLEDGMWNDGNKWLDHGMWLDGSE